MRFLPGDRKGQSTAEYAILIALVVAAAMAMQTYVQRSMQGGVKFAVDKMKKSDTSAGQYEPYYLESSYNATNKAYSDTEKMESGGKVTRTVGATGPKEVVRSGMQKYRDVSGAD